MIKTAAPLFFTVQRNGGHCRKENLGKIASDRRGKITTKERDLLDAGAPFEADDRAFCGSVVEHDTGDARERGGKRPAAAQGQRSPTTVAEWRPDEFNLGKTAFTGTNVVTGESATEGTSRREEQM